MTETLKANGAAGGDPPAGPPAEAPVPLSALVDRWRARGLISQEQGHALLRDGDLLVVSGRERPMAAPALAIEALGYLGGVIIVVAAFLISALYWEDLPTAARLGILGGAVLVLLLGGLVVPGRLGETGARLRSVLWAATTAAAAGFLGVLADEALGLDEQDVALLTSGGAAAVAVTLWWRHPRLLPQVAMMVSLALTTVAVIARFSADDALPGVGIWAVGACWAVLGAAELLRPGRAAVLLGSAAMVLGAMSTLEYGVGAGFALITAVGLVVVAVVLGDLALLGVGAIGTLLVLPRAVERWFPGELAAPLALLAIGIVLVGVAVWTARRRGSGAGRDTSTGPGALAPRTAWLTVAVLLTAATAAVVVISLVGS